MKKNSFNIIIYVLIGLIVLVTIFLFTGGDTSGPPSNDTFVFELYGSEQINQNLGDPFFDPGVKLIVNGENKASDVSITGTVDTSKEGTYTKTYTYNDKTLTRTIVVSKLNSFVLNGDSNVYVLLNGKYDDPLVEATYKGADYKDKIEVSGNVDYSKAGVYTITYRFKELNKSLQRKIHVSAFGEYFKMDYDTKTSNKEVTVSISVDKSKVSKYLLPDGTEMKDNYTYKVTKSGKYKFTIFDNYGNSYEREVEFSNINVEPIKATCKATAKDNKTTVTVTVTSSSKIVKYVYNDKESTSNTYTFDGVVKTIKVALTDSEGQKKTISCKANVVEPEKKNSLEIHFIATGYYDDAILIRDNSKVIFIDGGRSGGAEKVVPYLKALGITKIDLMMGSHAEYDHIQTQASILDNFTVDKIIYPVNIYKCRSNCNCQRDDDVRQVINALNKHNKQATQQAIPSMIDLGDMKMYFIAPIKLTCNNNNNSFINVLKFGNNTFMFTGDSDTWMNNVADLQANASKVGLSTIKVDMLKYPHHGNETIPGKFLDTVKPSAVVVPNYHAPQHPSSGRQQALTSRGAKIYRQSDSSTGNILITSDGTNIKYTMNVEAKNYKR